MKSRKRNAIAFGLGVGIMASTLLGSMISIDPILARAEETTKLRFV